MQENTVRSNVVEMPQQNDDTPRIVERAVEKVCELLPTVVGNFVRTSGAKSVLTLKISLAYNKDDEVEATIDGAMALGSEPAKLTGEILNRQLRLW